MKYLLILFLITTSIYAITTDELIKKANNQNLSDQRYWHLLLHYKNGESEIDDPSFFLGSKYDTKKELEESIRYFNEDLNQSNGSVFCRFPARRVWIENQLGVDFGIGECSEYEELIKKIDPQKVSLIFPSAHVNSPASMFGHTFLRIDSSMDSKLMSYAINYAARTDESNGFLFAIKGLGGGYHGYYSLLPYYEKLKEYRDSESRDVWEYDLNLTPDEVMAMVRHIYELEGIYSWYYFFDENCSYNMLWLVEIARPSVHLREHFFYYVIPPETIRSFEAEGLVDKKHYRPSKRTKLLAYEKELGGDGATLAKKLAKNEMTPEQLDDDIDANKRRFILESAAEYCEYLYIDREIDKDSYIATYHELLKARAALGKADELKIELKSNPNNSHNATRINIGYGKYRDKDALMFGYRPAYHDLDEDDTGHMAGATIEFLDLQFGVSDKKVFVDRATLLSLSSITPVSHFFKPFSYRMKAGWDREYMGDRLSFVTSVAAGAAIGDERAFGYLLSEPELRLGFKNDIGIGVTIGGVLALPYRVKLRGESKYIAYSNSKNSTKHIVSTTYQYNPNFSLLLKMEHLKQIYKEDRLKIGINFYF